MQQAELGLEGSRRSESMLGGYMTAPSEAPCVLGEVGHAPASPLASVQQRLRKISAQSLSGFPDPGPLRSAALGRPDYLRDASIVDRGPAALLQESRGPASQPAPGSNDIHWGREGERQGSGERQASGSSMFSYPSCTAFPQC